MGASVLLLTGSTVGLFLLGLLGLAMLLAGLGRLRGVGGSGQDAYLGGVMTTLGLLFAAIGFLGPFAGVGGL